MLGHEAAVVQVAKRPSERQVRQVLNKQDEGQLIKTPAGNARDYRDVIVFEKVRFQNIFSSRENAKPPF